MFHFKGILPHCATAKESICTYSSFCVLFHLITLAGYILLCCCCRQWLHSSLLFLKLELLCSYSSPLLLSLSLLLFCSRPNVLPCRSQIIKYSSPPLCPSPHPSDLLLSIMTLFLFPFYTKLRMSIILKMKRHTGHTSTLIQIPQAREDVQYRKN